MSTATIEHTIEENHRGIEVECVYATCEASGDVAGPIWGSSDKSVKRALATLSEQCSCGEKWHAEDDE